MRHLLIALVRVYQYLLSPWLGNQCRFYPTCSHYAVEALQTHGSIKGTWYAALRILKCNPWHPGGFDPIPSSICKHSNGTH